MADEKRQLDDLPKPIFNARIISYEPVTVMEFDVGQGHPRVGEWVRYVPLAEVVRHDVAVAICSEVSGLSPDIREDVQDVLRALEEVFGEVLRMEKRT